MAAAAYRESREAYVNSTRVIALADMAQLGVAKTSLAGDDFVRFSVYDADGDQLGETTDAAYDVIYTDEIGFEIRAWHGIVTCPATAMRIKIIWEYQFDDLYDLTVDYIDVQAVP